MATWVRSGTGTSPSALDSAAPLTGSVALGNSTAPGDFDPAGVTSVRIQWRFNISAGLSDDTWDDHRSADLTTPGGDAANVALGAQTRSASGAYDHDATDNTPNTTLSTANWEAATLDPGNTPDVGWADHAKSKGFDGTTGSIPVANVTVTITYTPGAESYSGSGSITTTSNTATGAGEKAGEADVTITPTHAATGSASTQREDAGSVTHTNTVTATGSASGGPLTLPFTDDFTGTNGDPWDSNKWPTQGGVSTVTDAVDIQGNEGRLYAGESQGGSWAAATAASITSLTDSKGEMRIIPSTVGSNTEWLYVCIRSSGEQQSAQDGRPATTYYFRFMVNAASTQSYLMRRLSNSEATLDSDITGTNASRNAAEPFYLKWEIEDDATVVGDTDIRYKMWDADGTEPTGWETLTDGSPGALHGTAGVFQLVGRNYTNTAYVDVQVDDISIDTLVVSSDKSGSGAVTNASAATASGKTARSGAGAESVSTSETATGILGGEGTGTIGHTHSTTASGVALEIRSGSGTVAHTQDAAASGEKAASDVGLIGHTQDTSASGDAVELRSGTASISSTSAAVSDGTKHAVSDVAITGATGTSATGSKADSDNRSGSGAISNGHTTTASGVAVEHRSGTASIAHTQGTSAAGDAVEHHTGSASIGHTQGTSATGDKAASSDVSISATQSATASGDAVEFHTGSATIAATAAVTATGTNPASGTYPFIRSAGALATGTGTLAVAYPADIEAGDLLYFLASHDGNSASRNWSNPSGWTVQANYGDSTVDNYIGLWTKTATGSESGTVSISHALTSRGQGRIIAIGNVDGTTPIAFTGTRVGTGVASSISVTGGDTDQDKGWAIAAVTYDGGNLATPTMPGNWALEHFDRYPSGEDVGITQTISILEVPTAGTVSTFVHPLSPSGGVQGIMLGINHGDAVQTDFSGSGSFGHTQSATAAGEKGAEADVAVTGTQAATSDGEKGAEGAGAIAQTQAATASGTKVEPEQNSGSASISQGHTVVADGSLVPTPADIAAITQTTAASASGRKDVAVDVSLTATDTVTATYTHSQAEFTSGTASITNSTYLEMSYEGMVSTAEQNLFDSETAHLLSGMREWRSNDDMKAVDRVLVPEAFPAPWQDFTHCIRGTIAAGANHQSAFLTNWPPATDGVDVVAGTAYTQTAHLYVDAPNMQGLLRALWYDDAGVGLGTEYGTYTDLPQGEWFELVQDFSAAPAGATKYVAYIMFSDKTTTALPEDLELFTGLVSFSKTSVHEGGFVPSTRIVGEVGLKWKVALVDYTDPDDTYQQLIRRYGGGNYGFVGYHVQDQILFGSYDDSFDHVLGSNTMGLVDGEAYTFEARNDPRTGDYSFYLDGELNKESVDTPNPWEPIYADASFIIGSTTVGDVHFVELYDEGVLVLRFDPSECPTETGLLGSINWTDRMGRRWYSHSGDNTLHRHVTLTASGYAREHRTGAASITASHTTQAGYSLDTTGAIASPSYPLVGVRVDGPVLMTGTATDDVGVRSVRVAINDNAQSKWWDGSGWVDPVTWVDATVIGEGTLVDWEYEFDPPENGGSYWYALHAEDTSGNIGAQTNVGSFYINGVVAGSASIGITITPTGGATKSALAVESLPVTVALDETHVTTRAGPAVPVTATVNLLPEYIRRSRERGGDLARRIGVATNGVNYKRRFRR